MTQLVVTIPISPTWSLPGELAARQALENALKLTRIGDFGGIGTLMGEMHLMFCVADESAARHVITQAVNKVMPEIQHWVRRLEELRWIHSYCPHTRIMQWHSRHDGRCRGCGKVSPELIIPVPEFQHAVDDFLLANGVALGHRRLRQFACACCRRIWPLLTDSRSRTAVEVAERYATKQAEHKQLESAFATTQEAVDAVRSQGLGDYPGNALVTAAYAVFFAAFFQRDKKDKPIGYDAQHAVNAAAGAARAAGLAAANDFANIRTKREPDLGSNCQVTSSSERSDEDWWAQWNFRSKVSADAADQEREAQRLLLAKLLADAIGVRG